jgi:hypothetical protein
LTQLLGNNRVFLLFIIYHKTISNRTSKIVTTFIMSNIHFGHEDHVTAIRVIGFGGHGQGGERGILLCLIGNGGIVTHITQRALCFPVTALSTAPTFGFKDPSSQRFARSESKLPFSASFGTFGIWL